MSYLTYSPHQHCTHNMLSNSSELNATLNTLDGDNASSVRTTDILNLTLGEETTTSDLQVEFYTEVDDYVITSVFILIAVLGVTLNLLIICIMVFGKFINKEIKILVTNLAVAELLSSLFFPLFSVGIMLNFSFPGNLHLCRFTRFCAQAFLHAGPLCTTAIALERCVLVVSPFRASSYTSTHKYIIVAVIWVCAIVPEIDTLLNATLYDHYGFMICEVSSDFAEQNSVLVEWLRTVKHILPAVVTVVAYIIVYTKLGLIKAQRMRRHSFRRRDEAMGKAQLMLVVDAMFTLVAWLPYNLYYSITFYNHYALLENYTDRQVFTIEVILLGLMVSNCCATPIIYLIFNGNIRKDAKLLFQRLFKLKTAQVPLDPCTAKRQVERSTTGRNHLSSAVNSNITSF